MTAGVVPVVADVGDLADLVEDGVSGYLVAVDDRARFVSCVVRLLADDALWSRMSAAAQRAAREHAGLDHGAARCPATAT